MSKDYRGFEEDVYNDVKDWEAFKRYEEIGNTVGTVVISILLAGLFLKILEGMGTPNVDVTAPGAEGIGGYIGSGGIGLSAELQLGLVTAGMTIGAAAGAAIQQASGNQGSSGLSNSGGGAGNNSGSEGEEITFEDISDKSEENWGKGIFDSVEDSLNYHFNEHGEEVGAKNINQYVRKAEGFRQNLRGANKSYPDNGTAGAVRYSKNGKYIIIGPEGKILSFGLVR